MPSLRTTKIAGIECRVVITMPLYTWQAKGDLQGRPVEVRGFKTESEAFRAWKLAATELAKTLGLPATPDMAKAEPISLPPRPDRPPAARALPE